MNIRSYFNIEVVLIVRKTYSNSAIALHQASEPVILMATTSVCAACSQLIDGRAVDALQQKWHSNVIDLLLSNIFVLV